MQKALLGAMLVMSTQAVDIENPHHLRHRMRSHLEMQGHPCSEDGGVNRAHQGDCAGRKANHCHVCPAGEVDDRSAENQLFPEANICVHKTSHCKEVSYSEDIITKLARVCPADKADASLMPACNLKRTPKIIRKKYSPSGMKSADWEFYGMDVFEPSGGNAYFLHVSPAADKIAKSGEIWHFGEDKKFVSGADGCNINYGAFMNCKGYAYLFPAPHDEDERKEVAKSRLSDVMSTFSGERDGSSVVEIMVNEGEGFKVETDPDNSNSVRYKGTVKVGVHGVATMTVMDLS